MRWITDLPDFAVGGVMAASVWFGACYAVLAPRAMDNDLETDIYPACKAQLGDEQDKRIETAVKRLREDAEDAKSYAVNEIERKLRDLQQSKIELEGYEILRKTYCGTGICDLIPMTMPDLGYSMDDLVRREKRLLARLSEVNIPVNISLPKVPSAALLERCTCAAQTLLTGKRTDYAMSLASFRMIDPKSITGFKSSVAKVAKTDTCGAVPWENLG